MGTIYYVGIDLGTSRTTIATSTGKRLTQFSCVGYSKDVIAKKRFGGRDYLIGKEALDNRLSLEMIWPLEDGVINDSVTKSMNATELILKNIIADAIPDKKEDDKIYAAVGVPAQASIHSKRVIINTVKDFINKILIVSEPFAVAYALDRLDECLIVDIGAGTVDLVRIKGAFPDLEDQITLKTAGNFLDRKLTEAILRKYPKVQITPQIIKNIKEKYGYVGNVADEIVVRLTEGGIPGEYNITDILEQCCMQLANPISENVNKLIADFDPEFQEKLRNNIIIAGGGSRLKGIDKAVEKGLIPFGGGSAICAQDSEFTGALGSLKLAAEMPDEYWEKI